MRISKQEQQKTHRKIVEAAVQVMTARGFRDATMREIAERARVGGTTIYKYFPTKESLLFGFFELRLEELIEQLKAIPDFHQYRFQEQLHVLLETKLALFAKERNFVRIAYQGVFSNNWIGALAGSMAVKDRFIAVIDDLVTSAVEVGEFEEPPFRKLLYELLWEYTLGITYYWLEDTSPNYVNTTQMVDKSLGVLDAILTSTALYKAVDLIHFLVREHVLGKIQMTTGRGERGALRPKRAFLGNQESTGERARGSGRRQKSRRRKRANERS